MIKTLSGLYLASPSCVALLSSIILGHILRGNFYLFRGETHNWNMQYGDMIKCSDHDNKEIFYSIMQLLHCYFNT